MQLSESTLKMLIEKAKAHNVMKLMLFGSCLRKPEDEAGDIDLAAEMSPGGNIFKFHGDLLFDVAYKLQKNIDMVNLTDDISIVPYILEEGEVIYDISKQNQ